MAREASITQEQINVAADAIRATGAKPSARAVRDVVGGGNMATVLKYLQVWQAVEKRQEHGQDKGHYPVLWKGLRCPCKTLPSLPM